MRNFIKLTDLTGQEIARIFETADRLSAGQHSDALKGRTVVMFFPESSIRTRVSFEKGIYLLGGQSILFPPEALDKREALCDVAGYLNNWADVAVIRHKDPAVIGEFARHAQFPVINAMTSVDHPCEVLTDMYALTRRDPALAQGRFLYVGANTNIGKAWREASEVFGFELEQCCPPGYEVEGVTVRRDIREAVRGKNVVCTDSLPETAKEDFKDFRVTAEIMGLAAPGAVLDPCPPFYRGEEVSADAIDSPYFVGCGFKKALLEIQQAIMLWCLAGDQ